MFRRDKKYWILVLPFLVIAAILAFSLPPKLRPLSPLVILVFWAVYYIWMYFEKKINRTKNNNFYFSFPCSLPVIRLVLAA